MLDLNMMVPTGYITDEIFLLKRIWNNNATLNKHNCLKSIFVSKNRLKCYGCVNVEIPGGRTFRLY